MKVSKTICFVLAALFLWSSPAWPNTESSTENFLRALKMLQTQTSSNSEEQTKEAVGLLEEAFADSSSPTERRQILEVLLESVGQDYTSRDAYLRYLLSHFPTDPRAALWKKDLADIYFEQGNLDESKVLYRESLEYPPVRGISLYKLAWVVWNKKNYEESLNYFFESFPENDSGVQSQIIRDVSALFWDIPLLSKEQLSRAEKVFGSRLLNLYAEFLSRLKQVRLEPTKIRQQLLSFMQSSSFKTYLTEWAVRHPAPPSTPCLFFEIGAFDSSSKIPLESLLSCAQKANSIDQALGLIPFFEKIPSQEHSLVSSWAYANLLERNNDLMSAAKVLIERFNEADESFRIKCYSIIDSMTLDQLSKFQEQFSEQMEAALRIQWQADLIAKLQTIDAKRWLEFEERQKPPESRGYSYWLKKAAWHASQKSIDLSRHREILESFLATVTRSEEKKTVQKVLGLSKLRVKSLPTQFGQKFKLDFDVQMKQIDATISRFKSSSKSIQAILRPTLYDEIQYKVLQIQKQIQELQLPDEMQEIRESFEDQKLKLSSGVKEKYKDFLQNRSHG